MKETGHKHLLSLTEQLDLINLVLNYNQNSEQDTL